MRPLFDDRFLTEWSSLHESAHAVAARHVGLAVEVVTMDVCRIHHPIYDRAACVKSQARLMVSAADAAACVQYLNYWDTGTGDDRCSIARLRSQGASDNEVKMLMQDALRCAHVFVIDYENEIRAVATELREYRELSEEKIDAAIATCKR